MNGPVCSKGKGLHDNLGGFLGAKSKNRHLSAVFLFELNSLLKGVFLVRIYDEFYVTSLYGPSIWGNLNSSSRVWYSSNTNHHFQVAQLHFRLPRKPRIRFLRAFG